MAKEVSYQAGRFEGEITISPAHKHWFWGEYKDVSVKVTAPEMSNFGSISYTLPIFQGKAKVGPVSLSWKDASIKIRSYNVAKNAGVLDRLALTVGRDVAARVDALSSTGDFDGEYINALATDVNKLHSATVIELRNATGVKREEQY